MPATSGHGRCGTRASACRPTPWRSCWPAWATEKASRNWRRTQPNAATDHEPGIGGPPPATELSPESCTTSFALFISTFPTTPKADAPFWLLRRFHQLADGIKHYFELGIVLLLQCLQLLGQIRVRRQQLPQAYKCAHDFDIDPDGPRAPQHGGQHGHALLGEGIGTVFSVLPAAGF